MRGYFITLLCTVKPLDKKPEIRSCFGVMLLRSWIFGIDGSEGMGVSGSLGGQGRGGRQGKVKNSGVHSADADHGSNGATRPEINHPKPPPNSHNIPKLI